MVHWIAAMKIETRIEQDPKHDEIGVVARTIAAVWIWVCTTTGKGFGHV